MDRWEGRVALVTGASWGIGKDIVRLLSKQNMKVAMCARSVDKLEELSKELSDGPGKTLPIQCDLRDEEQIIAMFTKIKSEWGGVDVCINNAGLMIDTVPIIESSSEPWRNMWEVNVLAPSICTREAVKSMRERNVDDGQIININSLSGHRVGMAHFYSVTKHALTALTESIRWELRGINSHIRVCQISPGLVETHLHATQMDEERAKELYNRRQCLQPKDIADSVLYVLSAPPHVQVNDILLRPTEQAP